MMTSLIVANHMIDDVKYSLVIGCRGTPIRSKEKASVKAGGWRLELNHVSGQRASPGTTR
ncbi:hypothetical protein E2C01_021809 [Portunus trituberculatus]|uniref:Uncharacterized protein n=1 Tax=Portunus trituberculatus TaxID=210409 RepID=A0A5B7E3K9_PORTR|nr:hypothetical protein [Portunus trituberculatus]